MIGDDSEKKVNATLYILKVAGFGKKFVILHAKNDCYTMVLHPLHTDIEKPERFTYPFCYEPHPLCQLAAKEVQQYIAENEAIKEDADRGKMFGVLVVEMDDVRCKMDEERGMEKLGFLAAYSGLLAGRNDWDYFVPPVYDAQQPDGYFKTQ